MSSKKLPAIQFYPSDWKNDTKVRSLSFHDRAIWFELLLIMHVAEKRGKLILNGKRMPEIMLAKMIGCSKQTLTKSLATIVKSGVAYVDEKGVIYNKRMVEDQRKNEEDAAFGSLGGNKKRDQQKDSGGQVFKTPPSVASSFSTSNTNSECVLQLTNKSVNDKDWLANTSAVHRIPTPTLQNYCNEWIQNANLRRLGEDYPANKLLSMMLEDLVKEKPKLIPPPKKEHVAADDWY